MRYFFFFRLAVTNSAYGSDLGNVKDYMTGDDDKMEASLVFIDNGRVVTDSLMVVEAFGKGHDKVLRDIRELGCSEKFNLANFGEVEYKDSRNRTYRKYLITQDGFTLLAMGYTGPTAMEFKREVHCGI